MARLRESKLITLAATKTIEENSNAKAEINQHVVSVELLVLEADLSSGCDKPRRDESEFKLSNEEKKIARIWRQATIEIQLFIEKTKEFTFEVLVLDGGWRRGAYSVGIKLVIEPHNFVHQIRITIERL